MDTNQKLALLQAYPLGTLEVEADYNDGHKKETACLIGLAKGHPKVSIGISAHLLFADGMKRWVDIDALTPILRHFAALTKQLPDGTIAAVEVANLIGGDFRRWSVLDSAERIVVLDDKAGGRAVIKNMTEPACGWTFDIYVGREHQHLLDAGAAYDYLRRNHFALPLNGQPLVAGVDFIEKQD